MKDVTIEAVGGREITICPQYNDHSGVYFEEGADEPFGYFTMTFEALMNALHEAGFPAQGWEPRPTLEKAKEEALYHYLVVEAPNVGSEVASRDILNIIKRVEGEYK